MKISDVRVVIIGTSWRNLIMVKAMTDEGVYGVGEATTQNREEGVVSHNANSPFCTAATAHACAAMTNFKILEVFDDFQEDWLWEVFTGVPRVVDGYLPMPAGPGIGSDLNEDAAREHPYVQGFFNLFEAGWEQRRFSRGGTASSSRRPSDQRLARCRWEPRADHRRHPEGAPEGRTT